ncbi:MAG: IS21 family transposase [Cyanobacteria bacterium]|nr:IS21 family transposase [Cyanobacteriota bacterium]
MIKLIDKQKMIIRYFNEGLSRRQIEKELHIGRKTISRYLKEYEEKRNILIETKTAGSDSSALIADICQKPKYDSSGRKKIKLTEAVISRIKFFLKENEDKKALNRSKQMKKKIDIYEAIADEGHDIGYTTICCAIADIKRREKEAYIRQDYMPGQVCEFDWGEVKLTIAGKNKVFQMPVFTTAKGNYRSADLYHNQKTESFLDSHANFFEEAGGVYGQMVYDNTRVLVAKFVGLNEKEPTEELLKLSIYYGFAFRFCNNYKAHEKGHAERSVEYIRRKVFSKKDNFDSYDEARYYLKQELKILNLKPQTLLNGKNATEMLEMEREYLALKPPRYDSARILDARVSKYSCVTVNSCCYSVPDSLVGEFVLTKVYPDRINCFYKGQKVAEHKRAYGNHEWCLNINHYLKTLKLKPGALPGSTAFSQLEPRLKNIYDRYFVGSEKSFIELLELSGKIGLEKIEEAIAELEKINPGSVSMDKIIVICSRKNTDLNDFKDRSNCQIEETSREMLSLYGQMLRQDFHNLSEVKA